MRVKQHEIAVNNSCVSTVGPKKQLITIKIFRWTWQVFCWCPGGCDVLTQGHHHNRDVEALTCGLGQPKETIFQRIFDNILFLGPHCTKTNTNTDKCWQNFTEFRNSTINLKICDFTRIFTIHYDYVVINLLWLQLSISLWGHLLFNNIR